MAAVDHASAGTVTPLSTAHVPPVGTEEPIEKLVHGDGSATQPPSRGRAAGVPHVFPHMVEKFTWGGPQETPCSMHPHVHCAGGALKSWVPLKAGVVV
jgi:hypothetical protein